MIKRRLIPGVEVPHLIEIRLGGDWAWGYPQSEVCCNPITQSAEPCRFKARRPPCSSQQIWCRRASHYAGRVAASLKRSRCCSYHRACASNRHLLSDDPGSNLRRLRSSGRSRSSVCVGSAGGHDRDNRTIRAPSRGFLSHGVEVSRTLSIPGQDDLRY